MYSPEEANMVTEKFEPQHHVEIAASTIIGTRKYQQDSYGCVEDAGGCLAVVCDGMGGLEGGEKASGLSIGTILEDYLSLPINDYREFLYNEAVKLDELVYNIKDPNGNLLGAGTTIVAVHIQDGRIHWLSVGDSKIYVLRNNEMKCIVREHNYRMILDEMLAAGKITQEQYSIEDVKGDALTSFLGIGNVSLIDISEAPAQLMAGDIILLCSDGVYKSLSDDKIQAVVTDNYFDLQRAADELTDSALRYSGRGQDNTTVVLVKYV